MAVTNLPLILLAAGRSSRMRGNDKLMEEVDGMPLITRQARLARSVTSGPVLVALPSAPHPRHAALAGINVTKVPVPNASEGINASIRTAFLGVPDTAPAAILFLADMPALQLSDFNLVIDAIDTKSENQIWRGATQDNKPGHPIIFASVLFDQLRAVSGDTGARDVAQPLLDKTVLVPLPDNHARLDLDTPEEWAAWRARR